MAEQLERPLPLPKRVQLATRSIELLERASKRAEGVYHAARKSEAHTYEALALFTVVRGHFKSREMLGIASPVAEVFGSSPDGEKQLEELLRGARQAYALFSAMGYRQMAFRSAMLVADIANVQGDTRTRDEVAAHLKNEAALIGLRPEAAELVSMAHPRRRPGGAPPASPGEDPLFWLRLDPAQAERFARRLQRVLELPDDRLRNIFREVESRKAVSREKLQWCRHIELLQNLAHAASPETHYARPPCFVGDCKRYHHRSQIEHDEFSAVIDTFKRNYCTTCPGREVWQEAAHPENEQSARS